MAIPGFFYVGPGGRIRQTFFEVNDLARYTANNVIAKLFPELISADERKTDALHLKLKLAQSDTAVAPGSRVTLAAIVSLPRDVHVYAPGVQGYKPVALELDPGPEAVFHPVRYPSPKVLFLPAIHEKVPVFEGTFRIAEDVTLAYNQGFVQRVMNGPASGTVLTFKGRFSYQACDSKLCYLPASVPVSWKLIVKPLDETRAPEAIRHK